MSRLIKRYSNRKLYDTTESRYVSREDIAEMVRRGESVRITDKDETEDLTSAILAQIIAEQGKDDGAMPSSVLHDLIRWNNRTVDKGLKQISATLEKLGVFPGETETRKLDDACEQLSGKIEQLEQTVMRLEDSLSDRSEQKT